MSKFVEILFLQIGNQYDRIQKVVGGKKWIKNMSGI